MADDDDHDEDAKTLTRLAGPELPAGALLGLESLLERNTRGELHQLGPGMIIDGKWEVRRLLGEGSFGQVYEAWHLKLDHPVAIKVLTGGHGRAEIRQRFLEEARLMTGMSSEHLVRASDYGELPDGSPYFVMDLVKGKPLRQVLRERLPLPRALEIGEELLEGLIEVHRRGVVHGDIKPENIVIGDDDGKARLLDFGLARTSAAEGEDVGGTPHYMAPEMLLEGVPASARTDVYAVGVVLYEMLTGRLPRGHLDMEVEQLRKAWASKPTPDPVLMHCKGVPPAQQEALEALDKLVMEALAREPTARPKSAQPLLEALHRLRPRLSPDALAATLTAESIGPTASKTEEKTTQPLGSNAGRPRATGQSIALAVGVLLLVAVVGWWWSQARNTGPTAVRGFGTPAAPDHEEPKPELVEPSPTFDPQELARARGGVLVAASAGASEDSLTAFDSMCKALGGERPAVEGTTPVICRKILRLTADGLMELAETAEVRVVVLVGYGETGEIKVRATTHHRGNALLAELDGLRLPENPTAVEHVAPVLKAVVGLSSIDAPIDPLPWKDVGAPWGVLSEWLRLQQGQRTHDDLVRREELARALVRQLAMAPAHEKDDDGIGFYRDLAMLVWGSSACAGSEPILSELSENEHLAQIRVSALLERATCRLDGDDAAAKADEARSLVTQARLIGNHPCMWMATIGIASWIDRWNNNDAQWEAIAGHLPQPAECDPLMRSRAFALRGDALVERKRWCDAADAYSQSYAALRTEAKTLLNWAEYDWRCKPTIAAPRQDLLDELEAAFTSKTFDQPQARVSLAYLRWWLAPTTEVTMRSVLQAYDAVADGDVGLIEGVASDLEREICAGKRSKTCSLTILTRPKQPGDAELLRTSLQP